jgi:predicted nucleotidyltransferase
MNLAGRRARYAERLDEAVAAIRELLPRVPGIERVSLFGSYARGRRDLGTDLDVLVIWETDKPFVERLKALYSLVAAPVDLDLVCYTPAEFRALRDRPFLRQIAGEEILLYEKKSA